MSRDPMGIALAALNSIASSPVLDKLGLRETLEKTLYQGTKSGFQAIGATSRQFKNVVKLVSPARPAAPESTTAKNLFDLSLSEEQQMMQESVQRFASDAIRPAAMDADANAFTPDALSAEIAELGLTYFAVPEELGGAGTERSPITNMIVAEELAYGDMGIAVATLAPIGVANALTHWGTADQQSRYLPAFLDEKPLLASIAVAEKTPLFDPNQLKTSAKSVGNGYILHGEKALVPLAENAELFLVAANLENKGPRIFIVESSTEGVTVAADPSMGLKAAQLGKISFNNVKIESDNLLGNDDFDYQTFINFSRLSWCSLALGTARAVLDYTVTYCNEREAFGEPISHRQSVAFMIANIGIELDSMKVLTQRAVAKAEKGLDFTQESYLARVLCGDKSMEIGTNGVQLLGGHGFTKEHPVERWYRDLRSIALFEGGLHL
ncbi:butyryl-CoA dehydrogenase [Gammaproteobacteria bacterium 45_16_T64]|nr:butyryl-CoA dehydrogenase [Gammaproteobacteria bacterium 45_16_T64]